MQKNDIKKYFSLNETVLHALTQHIDFPLSVEHSFNNFRDWFITAHIHLFDDQSVSKLILAFFLQLSFLRQISHGGVNLEAFLGIFSEKHSGSESNTARTTGDQYDLWGHAYVVIDSRSKKARSYVIDFGVSANLSHADLPEFDVSLDGTLLSSRSSQSENRYRFVNR